MGLKHSYSLLAPFYDLVVAKATHPLRSNSIQQLNSLTSPGNTVLLSGIGTGLDIPLLTPDRNYFGIDLAHAMLIKAKKHIRETRVNLQVGDVMKLPYKDNSFDAVVMHLIVAVVGNPTLALLEAERVLKEKGHLIVLDKFLKPGQLALVRRLINPVMRNVATQTSVTFENHLHHCSKLKVVSDQPVLAGGWFRRILLTKTG